MTSIGGISGSGTGCGPNCLAHLRLPLADRLPGAAEAYAPAAVVTPSFETHFDFDSDSDSDADFEARA